MKNKIIWYVGIIFLFSMVNCTGTSVFVGKWVLNENHDVIFEFLKDGSGILYADVGFAKFKWLATEDGLPTMVGSEADGKYNYRIYDSILTLTNDNFEVKLFKLRK